MGLKYEFDVEAYTMLCLTPSGGEGSRLLETFCFPRPRNHCFGLTHLGSRAGYVVALVDINLSTDEALRGLRALHTEVREHGVQEEAFVRQCNDDDPCGLDAGTESARPLTYDQEYLAQPVALIRKGWGKQIAVTHRPLYWQAFRKDHILLKPVVPDYAIALGIGRGTSDATVLRRLRRFIRQVERFGLAECNNMPDSGDRLEVFRG